MGVLEILVTNSAENSGQPNSLNIGHVHPINDALLRPACWSTTEPTPADDPNPWTVERSLWLAELWDVSRLPLTRTLP